MANRICPFDGKEFSSGASYRVHKSKYHRGESLPQQQSELPEEKPVTETPVIEELASPERDISKQEEVEEHSGFGWGWAAGLGGLALFLLLLYFGRRGGQQ